MSQIVTHSEIDYPESDGASMGETALHSLWINYIHNVLSFRYRGQRVQVACNLLVYFCEGEPNRFVVPDNFVALDCDSGLLRVFQSWVQGKVPDVGFEVLSQSTAGLDMQVKPQKYAEIGFGELFLYDPEGEYMSPRLQGFRLDNGQAVRIEPDRHGALLCERLGIMLSLEGGDLVMHDRLTGQRLLTQAEAADAARMTADTARMAADAARMAAEARAANEARARKAAEDEVQRLLEQLRLRGGSGPSEG